MKRKLKKITNLLNEPDFLNSLCVYSNNNLNVVLENICKIIMFNLYSDNTEIDYNIINLLKNIPHITSNDFKFILEPYHFTSNSILKKKICIDKHIEKLAKELKITTQTTYESTNLESILEKSLTNPFSFVEIKDETSIIIGEMEKEYYRRTLYKRFNEPKNHNINVLVLINNILDNIINQRPRIYITESKKNKSNYIELPSLFGLIQICARNKRIKDDTPVQKWQFILNTSMNANPKYHVKYSRLELLSIDDTFDYCHENLTGNPEEDILLIYAQFDFHDSKDNLTNTFEDNIEKIKNNSDIRAIKIAGKYHIKNGRHRLVYLKHYYQMNQAYYKSSNLIHKLKEKVTIPIYVEYYIEDKEVNEILTKLKSRLGEISILKLNPNNDKINLLLSTKNATYIFYDKEDLVSFYNGILIPEKVARYKVSNRTELIGMNYENLMKIIHNNIGKEIYQMSFTDLIKYIKKNPLLVDGHTILLDNIDLTRLHKIHTTISDCVRKSIIFENYSIEQGLNYLKNDIEILQNELTIFLSEHPAYNRLNEEELIIIIQNNELFRRYTPEEIKKALKIIRIDIPNPLPEDNKSSLTKKLYGILKTGDKK